MRVPRLVEWTLNAYARLETTFARIDGLEGAAGILDWDARTTMPPGAAEGRGEQLAALKVMSHGLLVADETLELLTAAMGDGELDGWERANLSEMARLYARASAVPSDLVEAVEIAVSRSEQAWRAAREAADFATFLPHLRTVLSLKVRVGEAIGQSLGLSPYDALMDGYDPGMSSARVDAIFGTVAPRIPDLIEAALEAQGGAAAAYPGTFPVEGQRRLALVLMDALGFDKARGRLDVSLHPFCGGAVDDVRITTRYREDGFLGSLMGTLHEVGHALYEQGLPAPWRRQPVGKARGMTLHESQSLAVEMQACRTRGFAEFLAPLLREHLGPDASGIEPEGLYKLLTRVEPGFIRVDADEITYPAHVLLRYDLERAMVTGELDPADLPGAFDDGMRELLRVRVPDDRLGCLQDIHWSTGDFGYFPTYSLGAMAAAQLFRAAKDALPDLERSIASGSFEPLVGWMRENVHSKGASASTHAILEKATGAPLGPDAYLAHLERRYVTER